MSNSNSHNVQAVDLSGGTTSNSSKLTKIESEPSDRVEIAYVNYKDELVVRVIQPLNLWFGGNEWHPEPQWLLHAYDFTKDAHRMFAMKDVKCWRPVGGA